MDTTHVNTRKFDINLSLQFYLDIKKKNQNMKSLGLYLFLIHNMYLYVKPVQSKSCCYELRLDKTTEIIYYLSTL